MTAYSSSMGGVSSSSSSCASAALSSSGKVAQEQITLLFDALQKVSFRPQGSCRLDSSKAVERFVEECFGFEERLFFTMLGISGEGQNKMQQELQTVAQRAAPIVIKQEVAAAAIVKKSFMERINLCKEKIVGDRLSFAVGVFIDDLYDVTMSALYKTALKGKEEEAFLATSKTDYSLPRGAIQSMIIDGCYLLNRFSEIFSLDKEASMLGKLCAEYKKRMENVIDKEERRIEIVDMLFKMQPQGIQGEMKDEAKRAASPL